jgi:hypothetical protein
MELRSRANTRLGLPPTLEEHPIDAPLTAALAKLSAQEKNIDEDPVDNKPEELELEELNKLVEKITVTLSSRVSRIEGQTTLDMETHHNLDKLSLKNLEHLGRQIIKGRQKGVRLETWNPFVRHTSGTILKERKDKIESPHPQDILFFQPDDKKGKQSDAIPLIYTISRQNAGRYFGYQTPTPEENKGVTVTLRTPVQEAGQVKDRPLTPTHEPKNNSEEKATRRRSM